MARKKATPVLLVVLANMPCPPIHKSSETNVFSHFLQDKSYMTSGKALSTQNKCNHMHLQSSPGSSPSVCPYMCHTHVHPPPTLSTMLQVVRADDFLPPLLLQASRSRQEGLVHANKSPQRLSVHLCVSGVALGVSPVSQNRKGTV